MRSKYKYLEKAEYVETWLNGGKVPIFPARKFWSNENIGTKTTDEVLQKAFHGKGLERRFEKGIFSTDLLKSREISVENIQIKYLNEAPFDVDGSYSAHEEDAYIDCYSNKLNKRICQGLGKRFAIRISDMKRLADCFDEQIGIKSLRGSVIYTDRLSRSHFRKGKSTSWQYEYRFVWIKPGTEYLWVEVPRGLCELIRQF